MSGRLIGIARHSKPLAEIEVLKAGVIGLAAGLAGDFRGKHANRKVTVLGLEGWAAACAALGRELPWTTRRANLLVEGLALPRQVGARLRIGPVVLEVYEECDPCSRMEAEAAGLEAALAPDWRGGLACRVIEGGAIALGDAVVDLAAAC